MQRGIDTEHVHHEFDGSVSFLIRDRQHETHHDLNIQVIGVIFVVEACNEKVLSLTFSQVAIIAKYVTIC